MIRSLPLTVALSFDFDAQLARASSAHLLEQVLVYMEKSGAARFERMGDFAARRRELNPLEDWRQGDSVHAR